MPQVCYVPGRMPESIDYSWEAIKVAREWAEGKRSHHNLFLEMEASPEHRVWTLVAIAQADAAEVVKYGALAQALIAKEAAFRSR